MLRQVLRARVRTSRSWAEGSSRRPARLATIRRPRTGTSLALYCRHELDHLEIPHDHAPLAPRGGRARGGAAGGLGHRAVLHRRAAAPLHRGQDEREPRGLHGQHREAAFQPDQLLAGPPRHRDRPEPAARSPGGQYRAPLRERALARPPLGARGRRHPHRSPGRGPEPAPGPGRDQRSDPGEGQGMAARPPGDLPAQDQRAAHPPGGRHLPRRRAVQAASGPRPGGRPPPTSATSTPSGASILRR